MADKADLWSMRKSFLEGTKAEYIMVELFPISGPKLTLRGLYRPPNADADSLLEFIYLFI